MFNEVTTLESQTRETNRLDSLQIKAVSIQIQSIV